MRRHDGSCRQIVGTQLLEVKSLTRIYENGIGTQIYVVRLFTLNSKENETFILLGLQGVQARNRVAIMQKCDILFYEKRLIKWNKWSNSNEEE